MVSLQSNLIPAHRKLDMLNDLMRAGQVSVCVDRVLHHAVVQQNRAGEIRLGMTFTEDDLRRKTVETFIFGPDGQFARGTRVVTVGQGGDRSVEALTELCGDAALRYLKQVTGKIVLGSCAADPYEGMKIPDIAHSWER